MLVFAHLGFNWAETTAASLFENLLEPFTISADG